jgi:predicted flavoprotein YhiN
MDALNARGSALLTLDLLPDISRDTLHKRLSRPRGKNSLSNHIRKATGLTGVKLALVFETSRKDTLSDIEKLVARIKFIPLQVTGPAPLDEAISTSGGVRWSALDDNLMLKNIPGVFCAGEMIDWDAPTGGYLITACIASGRTAATGILNWLDKTT